MPGVTPFRPDGTALREVMARVPTGVAIVTTRDRHGNHHGMTVSAFCPVSLDPPLVLVCLAKSATCYAAFADNDRFAVSVLREHQAEIGRRFGSKNVDKFGPGGLVSTPSGGLVVDGALATLECVVDSRHHAGDHVITVGEIARVTFAEEARPAVYFDRAFTTVGPPVSAPAQETPHAHADHR
ncbi:flavin reductase family protein [Actinokineospora iranica]|uniref:Flavin reductase ActVB n=1 Tax=Actinokineospora iranica TaxID=1271860 RepID=A0A1G6S6A2_9PSEU|nr:flavin reductase family protein [Actinokineospora iranica]SDD12408.1 flavin reductase ActVB [Actinokineospora iranica]